MKILRNERGYALALVLVTITLIFSFGAVLISKNIGSSKRINSTESYHLPVALAEMGVTYAHKAINQTLTDITPELVTKHTKDSFNHEEFLDDVANTVAQTVTENGHRIMEGESAFLVTVEGERQEDNSILFTVESAGTDGKGTYPITVQMRVGNEGVLESSGGNSGGNDGNSNGGGSGESSETGDSNDSSIQFFENLNQFTEKVIEFPTNVTYDVLQNNGVTFTEDTAITKSTKYNNGININSKGITLDFGADIYIQNDLNFHNNAAKMNVYGNISTGNINNAIGSTLNIKNYAEFRNGLNLQNTTLAVGENVKINGSVRLNSMNSVKVDGELNSENAVEISNSNDVTIGGFTRINGLTMNNSEAVIKNNFHSRGNLSIASNSRLIVHGSMNLNDFSVAAGTELIIYGDAIFSGNITGNSIRGKIIVYGDVGATPSVSNQLNNIINNGTLQFVNSLDECVDERRIYVLRGSAGNSPEDEAGENESNGGEVSISNDWNIKIQDAEY